MKELTALALERARDMGATFADMRIVDERQRRLTVMRRSLKNIDETESLGYGIRVLIDGAWGYASSTEFTADAVARTARLAGEMAKASALVPKGEPAVMAPAPGRVDTVVTECSEDPFAMSHLEQAELLLAACDSALAVKGVVMAWGTLQFIRMRRIIANTDGSYLDLTHTVAHPEFGAQAVDGNESQSRSYQGGARQAGFEFVRQIDLLANARRWAEEAVMKCHAEECPSGIMDIVLDPVNIALTTHESVGHATELDRILGWEANMAGRSFVEPGFVGEHRYGSEIVNLTADSLLPGGLGTWGYDDDGVELGSFPMVKGGVLVSLGCTRETAPIVGWEASNGCCRSDRFSRFPINRIPNLYLEPGADDGVTPEDLIAGVERGVWFEGRGSYSIDQMRNNFQFGGDLLWLIEGGKRTKMLKKGTYQAQTTQFWNSCDAIAGRDHWRSFGLMRCGKGEPGQIMRMTHGASPSRFRDITVGGAR